MTNTVVGRDRAICRTAGWLAVCIVMVGCGGDDEAAEVEETKRAPISVFDAGVPASGEFCSTLVAAECDGDEDCTGGKTCCGIVENGTKYNSLRCEEQCDGAAGGIHFCHPGDACPDTRTASDTEAEAPICRRSSLLPAYFAICGAPSSLLPTDFTGKPKAAGQVNCGETLTCGAGEQCCVLSAWDAETGSTSVRDGYCAPVGEPCSCLGASGDAGE